MDMYHLAFTGDYINGPAGDVKINLIFLRDMICYIGKKYGSGKGSNFAKGKRELKRRVKGCSTRNIKLMLQSVPNALTRNRETDDVYVFRFSTSYSELFKNIVLIMEENRDNLAEAVRAEHENVIKEVLDPQQLYTELLIRLPLISLNTVMLNGKNSETKQKANILNYAIQRLDRKYSI